MKEKTRTILYGTFVTIMVLALCIAYAQVVTELKIEGEGDAKEQEGVYIANVEYLTDNEADKDNSKINYTLGTMLDSKIVLGSSTSSSITYQVTIKNNTDREQVFIGIIKDETNEGAYNNTSIQPNVGTAGEITGLEEYVSTVAPGEYITFPVTYAYAGTDTSNNELQGKINFRFREKPILDLSNEGETYTLENIYAGYTPAEYEFTVSNYNENYTNGVPLTYSFETTITEGSPLTAKIYDSEGNEVTESITIAGDNNTYEDHTYTLKIKWDSSLDSTEYEGKSYTCIVNLTAIPDTTVDADLADYADYKIEQGFEIEITICSHTWENGVCTICGKICEHEEYGDWVTVTEATCAEQGTEKRTCTACGYEETQTTETTGNHTYATQAVPSSAGTVFTSTGYYSDGTDTATVPAGFTVSAVPDKVCSICGTKKYGESTIEEGLVVYLIDDKTEEEIANINWDDEDTLLSLKKTYDQFVWIPIPQENINEMFMCQSEDGTKSCKITVQEVDGDNVAYCSTHASTLMAGRLYGTTKINENGGSYDPTLTNQTYSTSNYYMEPAGIECDSWVFPHEGTGVTGLIALNAILGLEYDDASAWHSDLQHEYNEIVKSVYENEGFYVGRYETSGMQDYNTNVTVKIVAGSDNSVNASIGEANWYRMWAQQKKYAENKGLNSILGSSMIQGAAYDQVMKFIDPDTSFVKKAGLVSHDLSDVYQTGGLNYSGSLEYKDVAKNIYDLEGNVYVCTTTAESIDGETCNFRAFRGSTYAISHMGGMACYSREYKTPTSFRRKHPWWSGYRMVRSACFIYIATTPMLMVFVVVGLENQLTLRYIGNTYEALSYMTWSEYADSNLCDASLGIYCCSRWQGALSSLW